jgi:NTP pyrophosphatase (non-canonical NTP hydrolase)
MERRICTICQRSFEPESIPQFACKSRACISAAFKLPALTFIQEEIRAWALYNFEGARLGNFDQSFKGMVEEYGELFEEVISLLLMGRFLSKLAHGLLKLEQGIRGSKEEHEKRIRDAVGDLLVYTADFCNRRKMGPMLKILEETWNEVRERDWTKNKKDGSVGPEE